MKRTSGYCPRLLIWKNYLLGFWKFRLLRNIEKPCKPIIGKTHFLCKAMITMTHMMKPTRDYLKRFKEDKRKFLNEEIVYCDNYRISLYSFDKFFMWNDDLIGSISPIRLDYLESRNASDDSVPQASLFFGLNHLCYIQQSLRYLCLS